MSKEHDLMVIQQWREWLWCSPNYDPENAPYLQELEEEGFRYNHTTKQWEVPTKPNNEETTKEKCQ